MRFVVTYKSWGKEIVEIIDGTSEQEVEREVNRTLFAPDGKVLSVKPQKLKLDNERPKGLAPGLVLVIKRKGAAPGLFAS